MKIEIDQSGKIEQTNLDTIIGLANDRKVVVFLPKGEKRKIMLLFRKLINKNNIHR